MTKTNKKKKIYNIICGLVLALAVLFMLMKVGKPSFWGDELEFTLRYLNMPNIIDMLKSLSKDMYNLPLYYLLMYPVNKIVPYGEVWLLMPNIFLLVASAYLMKKIGEKIGGEDLGFIAFLITITSSFLMIQGAAELRPYALLFFTSVLSFYLFLKHIDNLHSLKVTILYTISLVLLAYTHWFGCLIIPFYFMIEVYLWFKKKTDIKLFIPYIVLGLSFLPWFILTLKNHVISVSSYWGSKPTLSYVIDTFLLLLSNSKIYLLLFGLGIILVLLQYFGYKKRKEYFWYIVCLGFIIWTFLTTYIYSAYINPKGSLFVQRYFMVVLPEVILLTSFVLAEILHLKFSINKKEVELKINDFKIDSNFTLVVILCILAILSKQSFSLFSKKMKNSVHPFKQIASVVAKEKDAYNAKSAVIVRPGSTYLDYYFTRKGVKLPSNVYDEDIDQNSLFKVVSDHQKLAEPEEASNEDFLEYDVLYIFEPNSGFKFSDEFMSFISRNYILDDQYPKVNGKKYVRFKS